MNINRTIQPFVVEVLNNEEYEGSPLLKGFCKEYLAQLVDKVEHNLKTSLNDIEEIVLEREGRILERPRLLRATIEFMVVYEIKNYRL
ncbi:MAG: hypothetical protein FWE02_00640 [Defluviitaleaceae bacterium]|nr:hypothetical protein [Defluviitaleaceae bacterium]